jgi:F-type H+-transporting ATPase subunit delta
LSTNAIARRYAKALVQLGAEERGIEKFHEELGQVNIVLAGSAELRGMFSNPAYGIEAKREVLRELCSRLTISGTVTNFLLLLLDKSRLDQLSQIVASYGTLADQLSGVVRPTLTTALPLDAAQVKGIQQALEGATGKKVVLNVVQDPSLIGGVMTKIGDKVFDGSVKTQLTMIKDILQKG